MLFKYFTPHHPPHGGQYLTESNPLINYDFSRYEKIVSPHSEVPSDNYDYVFNNDGLRTVDLSTKPNVITMGCSVTFGVGLPKNMIWTNILQDKLKSHGDYRVGNIAYNGASPMKNISAFFGFINKYNYLPEYVICNFANFERAYFFRDDKYIADIFWSTERFKFKDEYPYDYEKILPIEWIYYSNLDHIKMLEVFCKVNNIKLIWSTWSYNIKNEYEDFIKKHFEFYLPDSTRLYFPDGMESPGYSNSDSNKKEVLDGFKMKNWDEILCHNEYKTWDTDYPFHYAYDYHYNLPDVSMRLPHSGYHRHLHWAEMYYNKIKKMI